MDDDDRWAPYVSVGERRRQAAGKLARLVKAGQSAAPVIIEGRAIAKTAWGKAWCANMERYSDYANRLPRGRTYVRSGSVIDLQVSSGQVVARVSGSSVYRTTITVQPVPATRWQQICADCAGGIDSLVELLQGRLSKAVMDRLCRQGDGLLPAPRDIRFDCSCPDSAAMCKHVAAVLYGMGARFDHQPELLFTLCQVDVADLLSKAGSDLVSTAVFGGRTLAEDEVSALFGLDMDGASAVAAIPKQAPVRPARKAEPGPPPAKPMVRARHPAARLLAALRRAGWLDNTTARAATGLDADAVRPLLKQLVADGHARVEGQRRATRYVALEPRRTP
jgi:uncharacterized Zn finger protein